MLKATGKALTESTIVAEVICRGCKNREFKAAFLRSDLNLDLDGEYIDNEGQSWEGLMLRCLECGLVVHVESV